jgi:hypothetical protein
MFTGLNKEDVSILYQINNLSEDGSFFFKLDEDYSIFPYEKEVLLSTGSNF